MPSVRDSLCRLRGYSITADPQFLKFSGGARLQRLFSTFPAGLPGLGLLLLRSTLGVTVLVQGAIFLTERSEAPFRIYFVGIAAALCGVLMLVGFLTPLVGALLFAGGLINTALLFAGFFEIFASELIYEVVLSAAVILLGPGAFSLDARFFGRREIIIPKN